MAVHILLKLNLKLKIKGGDKLGPYCKFCGNRCFTHFPDKTPAHILKAYGTSNIIATCNAGQKFEKEKIGFCYDDIVDYLKKGN